MKYLTERFVCDVPLAQLSIEYLKYAYLTFIVSTIHVMVNMNEWLFDSVHNSTWDIVLRDTLHCVLAPYMPYVALPTIHSLLK